jgi:phosphatidate cytidylyltransferase
LQRTTGHKQPTPAQPVTRNPHPDAMHLKRWITGLVALPFIVYLVYIGGAAFSLLIAAAGVLALWEYYRIVGGDGEGTVSAVTLTGMATGVVVTGLAHLGRSDLLAAALALNLVISGFFAILAYGRRPGVLVVLKNQLQGVVYIPLLLAFLVVIRNDERGMQWIFLLLCVVFAGDICALYAGTFFGRHKLHPAVSPGKTIEGSAGGLIANLVVGLAAAAALLPDLNRVLVALFCVSVGIAGQVGDLYESCLKRSSRIKDSGSILPGHGGILDRIDALLFAAPVAFVIKGCIF